MRAVVPSKSTPPKRGRPRAPSNEASRGPVLSWPGRTWTSRESLVDAGDSEARLRLSPFETCGEGEPRARFIVGDALDVAAALGGEGLAGKVDLVYLDPPFASQSDYVHEARLDGPASGRVVRSVAYGDKWSDAAGRDGGVGAYLDVLAPRLEALAKLLSPRGTLWVHLDWRAAYLVRVVLDEIMGRDRFLNEVVWRRAPNLGRQAASGQFGRTLDTIVVYGNPEAVLVPPTRPETIDAKAVRFDEEGRAFTTAPRGDYTDASIEKLAKEGRVHRTATGRVYIKYFLEKGADGSFFRERRVDTLWTDVPPLRHAAASERTGFPTQKPRALLERIIACATQPGDIVVDAFAGSGTTGEAAHALGRRAIVGDRGALALATSRARFLRAGMSFTVEAFDGFRPAEGAAIDVRAVHRDAETVAVALMAPPDPLAWAVDASYDPAHGFRTTWHAERTLGARVVAPARVAAIPSRGATIAVRVFHDDGAMSEAMIPAHAVLPLDEPPDARQSGATRA